MVKNNLWQWCVMKVHKQTTSNVSRAFEMRVWLKLSIMNNPPTKKFKGKNLQSNPALSNKQWQVTDLVQVQFNSHYSTEEFVREVADTWSLTEKPDKQLQVAETKCLVYKNPFNCCQLRNFVDDDSFLHQLKHELLALNFHEKSNDLYKFHQSQDLKKVTTAAVSALKKFLYSDFRQWLIQVTGIELNATVDMSCAQYNHTGLSYYCVPLHLS